MKSFDEILKNLNDEARNYELDGVEFTEEDAKRVVELTRRGFDYDKAVSLTLSEIRDVLDEGLDDERDEDELSDDDADIIERIEGMFDSLSSNGKVSLMTGLYYSLYDEEKDRFLHETENG